MEETKDKKSRNGKQESPPNEPESAEGTETQAFSESEISGMDQAVQEQSTVEMSVQDSSTTAISLTSPVPGGRDRETVALSVDESSDDKAQSIGDQLSGATQPRLIGKYTVKKLIGKGGFGKVYLAHDPIIDRSVAIKMFAESDFNLGDRGKQRFFREAKAIGQLEHPHIITIHDAAEHEGVPYLVMEFLEGHDLADLLEAGQLPSTSELLGLMITICQVLDYAHRKGVVHRDLKPANIFYTTSGTVKLMDFGIAKIDDTKLTQTGMIVGTLFYMSPEQLNAQPLDGRADIYSLGVLLYELFSLRLPYGGDTITQVIRNIIMAAPHPFRPIDSQLPPDLNSIIEKAMARDVAERYQTADELAKDLSRIRQLYDRATRQIRHPDHEGTHERSGDDDESVLEARSLQATQARDSHNGEILANGKSNDVPPVSVDGADSEKPARSRSILIALFLAVVGVLLLVALYQTVWKSSREDSARLDMKPLPEQTPHATPSAGETQLAIAQTTVLPSHAVGDTVRDEITRTWQTTLTANSLESYKLFITHYQENPLAETEIATARKKIDQLTAVQKRRAEEDRGKLADISAQWLTCEKQCTRQSLESFIDSWAKEPLAAPQIKQARAKLDSLKQKDATALEMQLAGGPVMVSVPGGSFTMGDTFGDGEADETSHIVTVSSFRMSRYEVSFSEYDRFCSETRHVKPDDGGFGRGMQPVTGITWYDAVEFCNWLSEKQKLKPCYSISKLLKDAGNNAPDDQMKWLVSCDFSAKGYRLPTEAEWEFAARAGGKKVRFGNGQNKAEMNNIVFNRDSSRAGSKKGPEPIGSLTPNSLSLHDMSGNVWEWCWDWLGPYVDDGSQDPLGPTQGTARVIRGGSWKNAGSPYVRAANRLSASPVTKDDDIGFRVVRSP